MWNKFQNNNKGFTGLEAAIVLVAFVVVAAVFSYVMLGAGFYTTQKSQEVVHTGVMQASSSVELAGNVVANATEDNTISNVTVFLQLTSGGSSVDINKTLIVFTAPGQKPVDFVNSSYDKTDFPHQFKVKKTHNEDEKNSLIDRFEKYEISIPISEFNIGSNEKFQVEIKPPEGASYTVHRQAPPSVSGIMILV
ncbi:MAG: flagellin [Methanosarcinaceae archaeon]|nr:flagellin [Methanosarcinaceae archaeon]MDD4331415.1 flagellin [Methanosarcinaceae archaeon]